jgi:hypothetical protein
MKQTLNNKRLTGILAFALAVFLLAGIFLVAYHHHDDAREHDDCNICTAAHQITSVTFCYFILCLFMAVSLSILPEKRAFLLQPFFPGTSGRSPPA